MFSIGQISKASKVKVPTIRYYESIGLLAKPARNQGNQRRYAETDLQQLKFIKHARQLGLDLTAIRELISLKTSESMDCESADKIAVAHLQTIRERITALQSLEQELVRISACENDQGVRNCNILNSIADHDLCAHDHC